MPLDSSAPAFTALAQDYARYTDDDQWVWRTLFERQMQTLPTVASHRFLEGLPRIHFQAGGIPDFAATNPLLSLVVTVVVALTC